MSDVKNKVGERVVVDGGPNPADYPSEGQLKHDDKVPAVHHDAGVNDPPLRTNRPDVPVIQRLAHGAGEHRPLVDDDFDDDGRFRVAKDGKSNVKVADNEPRPAKAGK